MPSTGVSHRRRYRRLGSFLGVFDGLDDYVVSSSSAVASPFTAGEWTVGGTLRITNLIGIPKSMFGSGNEQSNSNFVTFFIVASANLTGFFQVNQVGTSTGNLIVNTAPITFTENQFVHVAATHGASGTAIYIDGIPQSINVVGTQEMKTYAAGLLDNYTLGALVRTNVVQPYRGGMRGTKLYPSQLSAVDVAAWSAGAPPAGALVEWELDEGEGTVVNDSSGNGHTGSAINIDQSTFWDPA